MIKIKINNFFTSTAFILLIFLPFFLIIGPFASDFACSVASLLLIFILIFNKDINFLKNKFFIFFIMYCFYLFFLSITSANIYLSLESSLFYFRFGFMAMCICWCIKKNNQFIKYFFIVLIFSFSILFFDSIIQFIFNKNILGNIYEGKRLSSLFGEEKILGSYIARLFPILIYTFLVSKLINNYSNFAIYIFSVISSIIVILSGERTALFIYIATNFLFILCIPNIRKIFLLNISTLILFILFAFNLSDNLKERYVDTTINSFFDSMGNKLIFSQDHHQLYTLAYEIFKDHIYFGVGPKMYREVCQYPEYIDFESCSTHPHNTYLQLLSETGIFGTLPIVFLFIFLMFLLIKIFFQNLYSKIIHDTNYNSILYICLFLNLWPIMPSGNFFNNWICIIYFIPLGFILYTIDQNKKNNLR